MAKDNDKEDIHANHRQRMRKRYLENGGFSGFNDHQILEFLLFFSVPRRDTNELAHRMIAEFGTIGNLISANPRDIVKRCGVGDASAILVSMIPELARLNSKWLFGDKPSLETSNKLGAFALSLLKGFTNERFYCICLDSKRRLITQQMISEGGITQADVCMRDIADCAMRFNATSIVLSHNHPSTDLLPSSADIATTFAIKSTMSDLNIAVIDHIIVGGEHYYSFAEHNRM
ncbi:UPF0758 protein [Clostridia bacterium]|nr:UPF0758 protein [Clostridia bacterium]